MPVKILMIENDMDDRAITEENFIQAWPEASIEFLFGIDLSGWLKRADYKPQLILLASGSEVGLIVAAADRLQEEGIAVRCVSMPSWELFEALPKAERDAVLPPSVTARLAVELGVSQGWDRYVGAHGDMLGVERFGASAPGEIVVREYGFTVDNVCARAKALLVA